MLRIGELAERAGVSVRALRYYEEQGLLDAERTAAGQRRYPAAAVEKVRFFQLLYAAGLSSRNIAELLPCIDSGHTDTAQRAMLHAQRDRIRDRIEELSGVLGRLDEIIAVTATHP
ncbi:MerR family transcriptional regulator [Nocardia sp. NPDC057227]|uniref:MerR family transcriptional regulator n=1 Tax=Nocardia sp. NPDC057227 TaxID=3346056 RepID=UPI00362A4158